MYYTERQNLVWWAKSVFILAMAGIILGLVLSPRDPNTPFWVTPFLALIGIILVFMFMNFRSLEIKIDGRFLEFGFGFFRKRIPLADIVSCEESPVSFTRYWGIGIRLGMDGTICYNSRFGKGVRIKVKDKRKDYVLTSNDPQALCQALKTG